MAQETSKEELLDKVEKSAHDYEVRYRGCSRCVMKAFPKHVKLGDGSPFKAACYSDDNRTIGGKEVRK